MMWGKPDPKYLAWLLRNEGVMQTPDYNMEGFYNAQKTGDPRYSSGINPNDQQVHFPDAFKLPNHETFSTDSNYYDQRTMPNTPTWQGGELPDGKNESWTLARPNGEIVSSESPWKKRLIDLFGSQ